MPDDVGKPSEWFARGQEDLVTAQIAIEAGAPGAPVLVLLQQAGEKYIKGYLISRGWNLKKIHDLRELVDTAREYDASFADFMDIAHKLTAFYVADRYPPTPRAPYAKEELLEILKQTEKLIAEIKRKTG